jgi:HEPN domain-containing protein
MSPPERLRRGTLGYGEPVAGLVTQAERDLEQARDSAQAGRHEWGCFAAHQAAEKALKSLHLRLGQEAWGHVLSRLITELPESAGAPDELVERGRVLDGYYVPTRYPNAHPEGAPFEHFGALQSTQAIEHADQILAFVRSRLA